MAFRRRRPPPDADAPEPEISASSAAIGLLARREYSIREMRDKLAARGYRVESIQTAIDRLSASALLDDRRVATAHIRTANRIKGRGPHRIRRELEARGIARDLIESLMAELPATAEDDALTQALARMRLPVPLGPADRRRAFQRLLRRGFSSDAIARALRSQGRDDIDDVE